MKLVQAAKMAATGQVPQELKSKYEADTAAAIQFINENPDQFGG